MLMYIPAALPPMPEIDHSMLDAAEYGPTTPDGNLTWEMKKMVDKRVVDDPTIGKGRVVYEDDYSYRDLVHDFADANPDFIEWTKMLPIKEYINLKLHYQHRVQGVPVHVDLLQPMRDIDHYHHLHFNEPAGYRVITHGAMKDVTYIWDENKEKVYCNMPEDGSTNTYLMNYSTCMHGVDPDPGRGILFFQITLDQEKHREIVRKSIEKYDDYAVRVKMDEPYG